MASFKISMLNIHLANAKQSIYNIFFCHSNPSSSLTLTQKIDCSHKYTFPSYQNSVRTFKGHDFYLLVLHFANHLEAFASTKHQLEQHSQVLFFQAHINGDFRFERFQELLSYKPPSSHHFKPQAPSVSSLLHQTTAISQIPSRTSKFSTLSISKIMRCL